jgi:CRISPR-associated protein Cpf1
LQGNIKYQTSLNVINNYDYHDKLTEREKERDEERKSWQTIEGIKDLKEGYLSQAIHKICNLMIEYNAIVVLEDLNFGFMRGRQKFEHSVYQKFEKMLIDKLNYLADKKKNPQEIGGLLKAYQLTNQFKSFKELGKQSGFLFYTQAWNTSKIDPVTGFVNLFDTRYTNKENARKFFSNFEDIRFNKEKNYFEFEFDYNNFTTKAEETRTKWTLCTFGERIETFRNSEKSSQWDNKTIDLTNSFKELFEKYGITYSDLKEQIVSQEKKEFFEELLHLLRLTLQMRNSKSNTDVDYIISPVADEKGNFYLSSKCDKSLPQDADANGAYNIARKGIMIVERIKASKKGEKLDLAISNKDWLKFAQNKPYRK